MSLPDYLRKMRGSARGGPPRVSASEIAWSWIGSFVAITAAWFANQALLAGADLMLMIGSMGASAALIFGAPRSPLAQPRNVVGGHALSASVGVACWTLLHAYPWLAAPLAVSTAIALMHATRTLHPPGGATALIAVIGSQDVHDLGWLYVLAPCTLGPSLLVLVALFLNNIPSSRRYPEAWF